MFLTSTAQQALRAVVYIAEHDAAEPVRVDAVAAALDLPRNYLSKTLHILAADGVLASRRGRRGGFVLGVPAHRLTLAMVVGPFIPTVPQRCLLSTKRCDAAHPCPVHARWADASNRIDAFLRMSVADVLATAPRARSRSSTSRSAAPRKRRRAG